MFVWGVYLIHFETPYRHARHYIGYSSDIPARVMNHFDGHGSRLVQVVRQAGITCVLARVWLCKDRWFERKLKNTKHGPRLCPICNKDLKLKNTGSRRLVERFREHESTRTKSERRHRSPTPWAYAES